MNRFAAPLSLAALALLSAVLPGVLRAIALFGKQESWTVQDFRGLLADVVVGIFVALACWTVRRWTRIGAWVLATLWLVVTLINYEHIRVLDAPASITYVGYLADPVFLEGSALQFSTPILLLVSLVALTISAPLWPMPPRPGRRALLVGASVGLIPIVTLIVWPTRADYLSWRQDNVLLLNARELFDRSLARVHVVAQDPETLRKLFEPDLSGTERFQRPEKRPNVLIILLEGFCGAYLPSLADRHHVRSPIRAPGLDAIAKKGVLYATALAHQRQTNRGEYSILCGDYPKLVSEEARMSEYAHAGTRPCLPRVLKEGGYRTVYLQAAPLAFMLKDQFMARAGFERALGTEYFQSAYAQNRWGVDDKAFFEQAVPLIRELEQGDGPWFVTMLTVGTHHPYLVPPGHKARGSAFARAVAYADEAVSAFIAALEAEGVLEDTLVLITADESAGTMSGPDLTRVITQSWIPLVALLPGGAHEGEVVSDVVLQSDLGLSILDYVSLADRAPHFVGRSIFRRYDTGRPVYVSNTHVKRSIALLPSGLLGTCSEQLEDCASWEVDPEYPFRPNVRPLAWRPDLLVPWRTVVSHSARPLEATAVARAEVLQLVAPGVFNLSGGDQEQILFGGQYLQAAAGERARVTLEVEVPRDQPAEGGVSLTLWFYSAGGRHHRPGIPLLHAGDRANVAFDYVFEKDVTGLEAVLLARVAGREPMKLRIHRAELKFDDGGGAGPGVAPRVLDVQRAPLTAPRRFTSTEPGHFQRNRCLQGPDGDGVLEGRGCKPAALLYGPYTFVPRGSRVTAEVEVEVTRGTTLAEVDMVNDYGSQRLAAAGRQRVTPGRPARFRLEYTARGDLDAFETRLITRSPSNDALIRIRTMKVEIRPPEAPGLSGMAPVR